MKNNQQVERIELLAYLEVDEIQVPVDAIILDNRLIDVDLRGWYPRDFNCLETDVKEGLRFLGFQTWSVDSDPMEFPYFEKLKSNREMTIERIRITHPYDRFKGCVGRIVERLEQHSLCTYVVMFKGFKQRFAYQRSDFKFLKSITK